MRLLLIRHAEPVANVAGIVAGPRGCTGLTETGRAQAATLANRLRAEGLAPDVVYSSVLPRAVETAELIMPSLAVGEVRQDCELCELHPGECDGLTWAEQVRLYGPGDSRSPDTPISPGGESLLAFDQRVRRALQRLTQAHGDDFVVVVSHGGFISAATLALLGAPGLAETKSFYLNPAYTSLTEWRQLEPGRWLLERYNDSAHLISSGA